MKVLALVSFAGCVIASNWLTAHYGLVFGLVTAGTLTAGLVLLVRDWVHEAAGLRWVFAAIAAGSVASAVMAGPTLAVASGTAFALAELADLAIYAPLRRRGRMRAAAASNAVGSVVDSALFLVLAGFPVWPAAVGQIAVKWATGVGLPALAWMVTRAVLRQPLHRAGA